MDAGAESSDIEIGLDITGTSPPKTPRTAFNTIPTTPAGKPAKINGIPIKALSDVS